MVNNESVDQHLLIYSGKYLLTCYSTDISDNLLCLYSTKNIVLNLNCHFLSLKEFIGPQQYGLFTISFKLRNVRNFKGICQRRY